MFYTEEDVQPAVNEAVRLFGSVGNMSVEKNTMFNVSLATKEFGKLWYGDITSDTDTLINSLNTLSKFTQQNIYVLDDNFDFDNPLLVIKS